ncbi:hypothetical protein [Mesorhizobium sp. dw_380]|uniref:hypothetical protein n=1 Tax=Mesorhizobium sp. dw_380 TaxID=2812001 RepID=UPI001BDE1EBB|nr:hypothetical protein [Mesorhizobium sp. dw_380]
MRVHRPAPHEWPAAPAGAEDGGVHGASERMGEFGALRADAVTQSAEALGLAMPVE